VAFCDSFRPTQISTTGLQSLWLLIKEMAALLNLEISK
jgi:hypothetical protein